MVELWYGEVVWCGAVLSYSCVARCSVVELWCVDVVWSCGVMWYGVVELWCGVQLWSSCRCSEVVC